MVLGSIPVLAWLAAALLLLARSGSSRSLRESLLVAAALAGGWLVLGTELLSLFHAIRFWPVLLWWAVPALALLVGLARERRLREWRPKLRRLAPIEWLLAASLALLLAWSWCQAVFAPPNNIDSVSYHLPR